jgi:hypothetical protein
VDTVTGDLVIAARYNGPLASANGGYACGVVAVGVATALGPRVAVTLHAPPPLDVPLRLTVDGRRAHLWAGDELVAGAAADAAEITIVDPVCDSVAEAAENGFLGQGFHPFPTCYVCGPDRAPGNGMFLRPGPVPGRPGKVACRWTPDQGVAVDGEVPPELVWAVLDCPGGWTSDPARRTMVLGRMVARIDALPRPGRRHVVVGQLVDTQARTATNLTALYDEDGTLLARAAAIWVGLT